MKANPQLTHIKKILILLLIVASFAISCTEVEETGDVNYKDTIELLERSLAGKEFNNLFLESKIGNKSIYIALDSPNNHWPKQTGSIQIETILNFNKQPDVFERAKEKRFVINPPTFEFFKDSARVSIYSYIFNLSKVYKFAKEKNKWKFLSESEYQY